MRVVAGRLRRPRRCGRRGGARTRPTSDRVREALFSILRRGLAEGARVLDLFAGSGALAIEALSRGAATATLVDSSPAAIAAIRRNLPALGAATRTVRRSDALAVPRDGTRGASSIRSRVPRSPIPAGERARAGAVGVRCRPVLAPAARVVAESDRRAPLELELPLLDERRYGDTLIRIHGSR